MIQVLYRIWSGENSKRRPPFYSKQACLRNFLDSFRQVARTSFCLINDGPVEPALRALAEQAGEVVELPSVGNSPSFWHALEVAIQFPEDTLVYFVEDDYLHTRDALTKLVDCHEDLRADYYTLYDHPVRYMPDYPLGADLPVSDTTVYISRSHHWRVVESTCMTFAATARTLREDSSIFDRHVGSRRVPADRELFRHLQGLGQYANDSPRRRLIGPVPSLATHLEEPWLAPVVDWELVAGLRGTAA